MEAIANGVSRATVFGHKGKSAAMDHIWANRTQLFADYLAAPDKIQYCRSIPWIGDITCYLLAKNFGAQVAKPDVHLVRVSSEEHTSELKSLMRISYDVFRLTKKIYAYTQY